MHFTTELHYDKNALMFTLMWRVDNSVSHKNVTVLCDQNDHIVMHEDINNERYE